jgi:hypothetical protein
MAEWSENWPNLPGLWWFYGTRAEFCRRNGQPERLHMVTVKPMRDGSLVCHADGEFLCDRNWTGGIEAKGVWQKVVVPALPGAADNKEGERGYANVQ